ncbi:MAG: UvrD-helicase domain-containing protein, partial [Lachnospiraceae bacterium]|nr:UvrD-helicase domain-containing protein [Lachnospiraceae bacterium]
MEYTKQQQQVIDERNKDILVCAGAGSGKTAVLIERIMGLITDKDDPVDIDRILVLTFTRAAAAQMRERLLAKMREYMHLNPGDTRMQMQQVLLGNAQITTIDSFCLYILKNHFHRIGIDPGFRIADDGEKKLIEAEVLERVMEQAFEEKQEDFLLLVEALSPGPDENSLEDCILNLAGYASSHPDPDAFLANEETTDEKKAWADTVDSLFEHVLEKVNDCLDIEKHLVTDTHSQGAPAAYETTFEADVQMLSDVRSKLLAIKNETDEPDAVFEKTGQIISGVSWTRIATIKSADKPFVDEAVRDSLKVMRDNCKSAMNKLSEYFSVDAAMTREDESRARQLKDALIRLTRRYLDELLKEKKERCVFDFSDIEHFALEILTDKNGPTEIADSYREFFKEIMVDEYQDSNQIQEDILNAICRTQKGCHNRFMVGDRKQSIYRFRMARPDIFNQKTVEYKSGEDNTIIYLSSNFRSRPEVINSVNRIFRHIMIRRAGDIDYDDNEALVTGIERDADPSYDTELMLLGTDLKSQAASDAQILMIAGRIKEMLESFEVEDESGDKGEKRRLACRDIAILARNYKAFAPRMKSALEELGIPAHCHSKTGYYSEREIVMCMDLLRCIENPYHDIPFVSALRSVFFSFSDEDLAIIRSLKKDASFYEAVRYAAENGDDRIRTICEKALS